MKASPFGEHLIILIIWRYMEIYRDIIWLSYNYSKLVYIQLLLFGMYHVEAYILYHTNLPDLIR